MTRRCDERNHANLGRPRRTSEHRCIAQSTDRLVRGPGVNRPRSTPRWVFRDRVSCPLRLYVLARLHVLDRRRPSRVCEGFETPLAVTVSAHAGQKVVINDEHKAEVQLEECGSSTSGGARQETARFHEERILLRPDADRRADRRAGIDDGLPQTPPAAGHSPGAESLPGLEGHETE